MTITIMESARDESTNQLFWDPVWTWALQQWFQMIKGRCCNYVMACNVFIMGSKLFASYLVRFRFWVGTYWRAGICLFFPRAECSSFLAHWSNCLATCPEYPAFGQRQLGSRANGRVMDIFIERSGSTATCLDQMEGGQISALMVHHMSGWPAQK